LVSFAGLAASGFLMCAAADARAARAGAAAWHRLRAQLKPSRRIFFYDRTQVLLVARKQSGEIYQAHIFPDCAEAYPGYKSLP
jgi:hypothetical protein